ncbi:MAG: DUF3291 domain-containing protein [Anaerolineae bacterium]|jgi:hypothetical protein|nr:DUF3291 domain-containing protein [Anaerolineae bacterium]
MTQYHLAQLNIATMLGPIDSDLMADFVAQLATINALADAAPGFVWRLQTPAGDATALRPFDDERLIVNMSVWDSLAALHQFTYYSAHAAVYRDRGRWFHRVKTPVLVLWWVPAGHIPSLPEARERLDWLAQHGPTPQAFTFKQSFPPAV